jgi:hypothetical protein
MVLTKLQSTSVVVTTNGALPLTGAGLLVVLVAAGVLAPGLEGVWSQLLTIKENNKNDAIFQRLRQIFCAKTKKSVLAIMHVDLSHENDNDYHFKLKGLRCLVKFLNCLAIFVQA